MFGAVTEASRSMESHGVRVHNLMDAHRHDLW
jgi:hypothetical protein